MLPMLHRQCYQEFQQALEQLQTTTSDTEIEGAKLRNALQTVQQLFQQQIATLNADELAPNQVARWQSLQTEIHKQMRLLQTDVMLLLSSRQSATSQRRTSEVRNRLNTLIQYCQALLQL